MTDVDVTAAVAALVEQNKRLRSACLTARDLMDDLRTGRFHAWRGGAVLHPCEFDVTEVGERTAWHLAARNEPALTLDVWYRNDGLDMVGGL